MNNFVILLTFKTMYMSVEILQIPDRLKIFTMALRQLTLFITFYVGLWSASTAQLQGLYVTHSFIIAAKKKKNYCHLFVNFIWLYCPAVLILCSVTHVFMVNCQRFVIFVLLIKCNVGLCFALAT